MFSANCAFRLVDNQEFREFCKALRPGYNPPDRKTMSGPLLENFYEKMLDKSTDELSNQCVCLSIDGWSNIRNQPVVCATISRDDGKVYLVNTINTATTPHTSENLLEMLRKTH